jgi:Lrp/AsnC family leucine-responsive transcriptional regulator
LFVAFEKELDTIDWQILGLLQKEGRLKYAEIGQRVGLSSPAAAERVRRLEEAGIIEGYRAVINLPKIGLPLTVFIRMSVPVEKYPQFKQAVARLPGILECCHIAGAESFMLKAALESVSSLEALIEQLSRYGQTATAIVMSTLPLEPRVLLAESMEK